jgi:CBS domain containing-hemolysin-like protein
MRPPEGPYETLAGLIATGLGRIPAAGDVLEVARWRLTVVDAAGRRAARVLMRAPFADEPEAHRVDGTRAAYATHEKGADGR